MKGVGGPLISIGDLLSDVGDEDVGDFQAQTRHALRSEVDNVSASHLPVLFQENFAELKGALDGADHSWAGLTLKLCSALETADKMIDLAHSNVVVLSEKVEKLEQIVSRRESAFAAAKANTSLSK